MTDTAFQIGNLVAAVIKPYPAEELHRLEVLDGYFDCHSFHEAEVTSLLRTEDRNAKRSATYWLARLKNGGAWVVWYPSGQKWSGVEGSKAAAVSAAVHQAWLYA